MVKRFTAYDLEETWELDDVCPGPPNPAVYHKSLLYFVARALEPGSSGSSRSRWSGWPGRSARS